MSHLNANITLFMCADIHVYSTFRSRDTQQTLEMLYQNLRRYGSANVYGTANWYNVRLL